MSAARADGWRVCAWPTAALSGIVDTVGIQAGSESHWGTRGHSFHEQERHVTTCLHLTFTCICLFAGASIVLTQTPHTFAICIPSYLLHCLPLNIQERKKLWCQQNSHVFTSSILNEEAPTHGKISEKSKDGSKRETVFSLPLKLNWHWLIYQRIYRWLGLVLRMDVNFSVSVKPF